MSPHAGLRVLALGVATCVLPARLAAQAIAGVAGATLPGATAPSLTGIRIDPIDGHTEVSIAAAGATFRVAPPVEHAGRVRVVVELPGARLGTLEGPSLPADNGAILALRANEDDAGARITIDIVAGARFEARTGAGGLLLVVQGGGAPPSIWDVSAEGQEAPRIEPSAAPEPSVAVEPSAAPRVAAPPAIAAASAAAAPAKARPGRATGDTRTALRAATVRRVLAAGWAAADAAPVSAPWAMILMGLVLGPPALAVSLARRRSKAVPMPQLHTVFPDGTRQRLASSWTGPVPPRRTDIPRHASGGRARPSAPGRADGR